MTFDFHMHFHAGQGDISQLLHGMDEQQIDMGAIFAVVRPGEDGEAANALVAAQVAKHSDRLVGLACVVPQEGDAPERLRRYIRDEGFLGLKIHPSMQGFYPSDERVRPTILAAAELGIPILIHTTTVPIPNTRSRYDDPLEIDDLALEVPDAIIVMAHGEPLGHGPAIAAKHPNVYMDTTSTFARACRLIPGIGEETLQWMAMVSGVEGSGKVIYGSDANPLKTERFAYNLEPLRALDIAPAAKARILGGNARELLGL
jgi:predicted TIM-barrel fold metal-dependent hydrolase